MKLTTNSQYSYTQIQPTLQFSGSDNSDSFNANDDRYHSEADKIDFSERTSRKSKNKNGSFEPGVTNKQKAKYYGKKTGAGLLTGLMAVLSMGAFYQTGAAFRDSTPSQQVFEEAQAETVEMLEQAGEGEEILHLEHYFDEIYQNLFINGEINQEQLNIINEQIDNIKNSDLNAEDISRIELLIEASDNVDDLDEMLALNETFLKLYVEDDAERAILLEKSTQVLQDGYQDLQSRSTMSKIWNPLVGFFGLYVTTLWAERTQKVKKPKPE